MSISGDANENGTDCITRAVTEEEMYYWDVAPNEISGKLEDCRPEVIDFQPKRGKKGKLLKDWE